MATLLDAIRARKAMDDPVLIAEPYVVPQEEWDAWDGSDETCSWVSIGRNRWAHRVSGLVFVWKMAFVLPGDETL